MVSLFITVRNSEESFSVKSSEEKTMSPQRIINIVLLIIIVVLVTGIGVYVSKYTVSVLVFVMISVLRCMQTIDLIFRKQSQIPLKDEVCEHALTFVFVACLIKFRGLFNFLEA